MSVCMSAVSAGVSEVLIKYTGNVWLQINSKLQHIHTFSWQPWKMPSSGKSSLFLPSSGMVS